MIVVTGNTYDRLSCHYNIPGFSELVGAYRHETSIFCLVAKKKERKVELEVLHETNTPGRYLCMIKGMIPYVDILCKTYGVINRLRLSNMDLLREVVNQYVEAVKFQEGDILEVLDKRYEYVGDGEEVKKAFANALVSMTKFRLVRNDSTVLDFKDFYDVRVIGDLSVSLWNEYLSVKDDLFSGLFQYLQDNKMIRDYRMHKFGGTYFLYGVNGEYSLCGMYDPSKGCYMHYILTAEGVMLLSRISLYSELAASRL